jgi:hypothetical protein
MITGFVPRLRSSTYETMSAAAFADDRFEHRYRPIARLDCSLSASLHIEISHFEGMCLDEVPARLHFVAHQNRKDLVHAGHVFECDPQ